MEKPKKDVSVVCWAIIICLSITEIACTAQPAQNIAGDTSEKLRLPATFEIARAPAPLFRDPVYDGAADPEIIWNHNTQEWWIFYTNRRATAQKGGAEWAYANPIGVAASKDGREWKHLGYCSFGNEKGSKDMPENTYWAPAVVFDGDIYHMFVSLVQGHPKPWGGERHIVHYTSEKDLLSWKKVGTLPLNSTRVIDATVIKAGSKWKLWYKDEQRGSLSHLAISDDGMKTWTAAGPVEGDVNGDGPHEGGYVFYWKDFYWMITDPRGGIPVYRSEDSISWKRAGHILGDSGLRPLDNNEGRHASVAVVGDRAFIFYFVHPWAAEWPGEYEATVQQIRSVLQVAELEYKNGEIICDRDKYYEAP